MAHWRYAVSMAALTTDQLELLQRTRDGQPMWGGSLATERLRREVELLLKLRLVEAAGHASYRLTALGAQVLDALSRRPAGSSHGTGRESGAPRSGNHALPALQPGEAAAAPSTSRHGPGCAREAPAEAPGHSDR